MAEEKNVESLTGHGARGKAYVVLESYRIRTGEEPGSIFVPCRAVPTLHGTGRETRLAGSCLSLFISLSLSPFVGSLLFLPFLSFPFFFFSFMFYTRTPGIRGTKFLEREERRAGNSRRGENVP